MEVNLISMDQQMEVSSHEDSGFQLVSFVV